MEGFWKILFWDFLMTDQSCDTCFLQLQLNEKYSKKQYFLKSLHTIQDKVFKIILKPKSEF